MIGVSLLTLFIFYLVLTKINYSLSENQKLLAHLAVLIVVLMLILALVLVLMLILMLMCVC